jgi:hypothetical protein
MDMQDRTSVRMLVTTVVGLRFTPHPPYANIKKPQREEILREGSKWAISMQERGGGGAIPTTDGSQGESRQNNNISKKHIYTLIYMPIANIIIKINAMFIKYMFQV